MTPYVKICNAFMNFLIGKRPKRPQSSHFYKNMDHECKQHPWFAKINIKTFSNDIEKVFHRRLKQLQNNLDECTLHQTLSPFADWLYDQL